MHFIVDKLDNMPIIIAASTMTHRLKRFAFCEQSVGGSAKQETRHTYKTIDTSRMHITRLEMRLKVDWLLTFQVNI